MTIHRYAAGALSPGYDARQELMREAGRRVAAEALAARKWHPMPDSRIHGTQRFHLETGIMVEVVRCYEDEWTVFLTSNCRGPGTPCACPFPRPAVWPEKFPDRNTALRAGKEYFKNLTLSLSKP